jgi:signal transduction histidine kinase
MELKEGIPEPEQQLEETIVQLVKEKIGAFAFFKNIAVVKRLPLTSIDHVVSANGVRVDFNFDSAPWLHTNKSYLHSVFYNLIINSIKYRHPERQPAIVIRSEKVDNGVVLTFSDNGLGIDMERNGGAIFGLFKRFHNVSDGRGLGLFMVKSQVEALGGTITVTSTVNTGTTFRVFFPQTKE